MFDYVTCKRPLPDGNVWPDCVCQTKEFECELREYVIAEDGRLLRSEPWRDSTTSAKYESVPFHGLFRFYTSGGRAGWFEYEAKYTDGLLVEIKAIVSDGKRDEAFSQ